MSKAKHHVHVLDIYGVEIHAATNKREWRSMRKKLAFLKGEGEATPTSAGTTWFAGRSCPVLAFWIDTKGHKKDPGNLIDTCAHEASHGANRILEHISTDVNGGNEPHAYLVGWLARWLWEAATS